jgi:hypothetical protein
LLKPENHLNVPIIRMELTFDDNKMQFYPTINAINELLQSIVEKISNSLPGVIKMFILTIQLIAKYLCINKIDTNC